MVVWCTVAPVLKNPLAMLLGVTKDWVCA